MPRAQTASTHPEAEAGAARALSDNGNAVDAVVGGFLAAGASDASVLLCPVVAMVAGVGVGARCFDGRSCQPGAGAARPRGYLTGDVIPPAAMVAVPRALAALALMHVYAGSRPLTSLSKAAAKAATKGGYARRARLLDAIGQRGASVLQWGELVHALCAAAGPTEGGLITKTDLEQARPAEASAELLQRGELSVATPGWPQEPLRRPAHVVVAADGRGLVAALAFAPDADGLPLETFELVLPRDATPVRRGVPRVTPGTPCATAAPIAILKRPEGWYAAAGMHAAAAPDAETLADAVGQAGASLADQLAALTKLSGGQAAVAASVQRGKAVVTRTTG